MFIRIQSALLLGTVLLVIPAAGSDIRPVDEAGRKIYVNDVPSPREIKAQQQAAAPMRLIYWSNTERRWKRVPKPTPWALEQARSAAAEVSGEVAARPVRVAKATRLAPTAAEANPNYRTISRGRAISATELDSLIEAAAARHGVDANLVRALIKVESNFNPRARSHKGAMGLMQLMPGTARALKVADPYDPEQNVEGGVRHLRDLMDDHDGNVELSLAAYNAGSGAVQRYNGVPPYKETRNYVRRITQMYSGSGRTEEGIAGAPIRVVRDSSGKLTFTNVE
jgi:soluble lytic murein transglycosylase-like protein